MSGQEPASLTAVVTGARRGIGRATAVALGKRGMQVAVTSRRTDGGALDQTVAAVEAAGGTAVAVPLDLADRAGIDAAVAAVGSRCGPVSVLVNNALCDQPGSQEPIESMDFDAFERMIVGEVVNTSYLTRRVLLELAHPDGVTVINVGSGAARHAPPRKGAWTFAYSATKAALHRLAPFLEVEFAGRRVRSFTVDPGYTRTEALLERLGDVPGSAPPEMPAEVIAWLALDPAGEAHRGRYVSAPSIAEELGWRF